MRTSALHEDLPDPPSINHTLSHGRRALLPSLTRARTPRPQLRPLFARVCVAFLRCVWNGGVE